MSIRKPKPGTHLLGDDVIAVVDGAMTGREVFDLLRSHPNYIGGPDDPIERVETRFYYHTAAQRRRDGQGIEYDTYWSEQGEGSTSIWVAILREPIKETS